MRIEKDDIKKRRRLTEERSNEGLQRRAGSTIGRNLPKRLTMYFLGLFIMTAGIAFSVISDLGVSPLSTLPYAVELWTGFDMGLGTMVMHSFFVLVQLILLRKKFHPMILLQIPAGIVFGWFTTLCNGLVSMIPKTDFIPFQILLQLISILLTAIGISVYLPANIIPLAGEGIVNAISITFNRQFAKVKIIFDASTVTVSALLCLLTVGRLGSVGIGTVMSAFLTGMIIAWINKFMRKLKKEPTK